MRLEAVANDVRVAVAEPVWFLAGSVAGSAGNQGNWGSNCWVGRKGLRLKVDPLVCRSEGLQRRLERSHLSKDPR